MILLHIKEKLRNSCLNIKTERIIGKNNRAVEAYK